MKHTEELRALKKWVFLIPTRNQWTVASAKKARFVNLAQAKYLI